MSQAYKFSSTASEQKPNTVVTKLLEKAMSLRPLNRQEKDAIAEVCYGIFGSQFAGLKLDGWKWDLSDCLSRFFVEYTGGLIYSYYAADKTALRKVLAKGVKIKTIVLVRKAGSK